jgi:hypothetical protein
VRITPRISDALPTYPENHFIHTAFAACACMFCFGHSSG